jgi:hypothetical protein
MAILKVAHMGHPVLRAKALPVPPAQISSPGVQRLIDDMFETMHEYTGIGLAAPQVHEGVRIFVAGVRQGPIGDALTDDENMPMMTLINPSGNTVNAQINFYADDGSPLTLPLTFPQFASNTFASSVPVSVGPNDSVVIESKASTSSIGVGWADVQATGALSGYSIFALSSPGLPELAGTVLLDSRLSPSLLLPYDNTNGYRTAVALANQTSTLQTVTATLIDQSGVYFASTQISLPAFGHSAFFLSSQAANSVNQLGILMLQSAGGVTGVGLRFSPTGSFTSIPIIR